MGENNLATISLLWKVRNKMLIFGKYWHFSSWSFKTQLDVVVRMTYLSFEHFLQHNHCFSRPIAIEKFEGFYGRVFVGITIQHAFRDAEVQYHFLVVVRRV